MKKKQRIDSSGLDGVATADIRDDYAPAGDMMIYNLCESRGYVQRKVPVGSRGLTVWKIFKREFDPFRR